MNKLLYDTQRKILARDELAREVKRRQQAGERAVFTNDCFDLLHLGHVRYLQEARAQSDFLILGLNDDAGVRALNCVDYLTVFAEPTASSLVRLLQPAIYVKGGDYANANSHLPDTSRLPEAKVVQEYGGSVRLIPYLPNHSTT